MSLVLRLMLGMGAAVLLALLLSVGFITNLTSRQLDSYNLENVQVEYSGKVNQTINSLTNYFDFIESQLLQMAGDSSTQSFAQNLYYSLDFVERQSKLDPDEIRPKVEAFYKGEFADEFRTRSSLEPDYGALVSQLDNFALTMQYLYIIDNPNPLGEKSEMAEANAATSYNFEHMSYHLDYKTFLERFGYYDIFFVEVQTGRVYYSVFKELDFGTSLLDGPFADSGLADAFRNGVELEKGETYYTNYAPYVPSYNGAAAFVSTPLYDISDEKFAVLIYQMPLDKLTNDLTQNRNWASAGFGETGEVYLVGSDLTMRTESRMFVEQPDEFYAELERDGVENVEEIKRHGSVVGRHVVDNEAVRSALNGETGFTTVNKHGSSHLTAYAPFGFGSHQWAVIAEIEQEEAFESSRSLVSQIINSSALVTVAILVLVLSATVVFARYLIRPLNRLSRRFERLNSSDADLTTRVDKSGIPEIDRISSGFNTFISQIHKIVGAVQKNAQLIASASGELNTTTQSANKSAQVQQEEVGKVTSALQQFNVAIEQVASQSSSASQKTTTARETASHSSEQSRLSNDKITTLVTEISDASENLTNVQSEVSSIVELLSQITSIADQTNLLALNAAIEAARAGESGRGFAVVADEVRSLAKRTQDSTVQIHEATERLNKTVGSAVRSMSNATGSAQDGIDLVSQVTAQIEQLDEAVSNLADINQSVAAATDEQKLTAGTITDNVVVVTQSSVELGQSAAQVAKASQELSRIASELSGNVSQFKT